MNTAMAAVTSYVLLDLPAGTEDFEVTNVADQISAAQLAEFFELEFDADFLWVECDKTLVDHYPTLLTILERVTQQQHISIIILMIG